MSILKDQSIATEQGAASKMRLALDKLLPHVLHYASMPHAHADAHSDLADARRVLVDFANDSWEVDISMVDGAAVALQVLENIRLSNPELIADNLPGGWCMNKLRQALKPGLGDAGAPVQSMSEDELADFMLKRIENGQLELEDIPVRLARYGLMEPQQFMDEMRERMESEDND